MTLRMFHDKALTVIGALAYNKPWTSMNNSCRHVKTTPLRDRLTNAKKNTHLLGSLCIGLNAAPSPSPVFQSGTSPQGTRPSSYSVRDRKTQAALCWTVAATWIRLQPPFFRTYRALITGRLTVTVLMARNLQRRQIGRGS